MAIFSLFFSVSAPAQDLGEIARQQRAQQERAQSDAHPLHVYTNDDLKRPQILTPEDRKRAEADKAASGTGQYAAAPAPAQPDTANGMADGTADTAAAPKQAAQESLGDFARRVMALKAQQDRLKKEREARLRNQLPLELPPPGLIGAPALAYPAFPEPSVKMPLQPAPVTPGRAFRTAKGISAAPALPFAHYEAPPLAAVIGSLAANPPLPRTQLAVPVAHEWLDAAKPPAVPSTLFQGIPAGALAAPPAAPLAPPAAARSRAQSARARFEFAVPPPATSSVFAVRSAPTGDLAKLPAAPWSPLEGPRSRNRRENVVPPEVPLVALPVSGMFGTTSAPLVPWTSSSVSLSRPRRDVPSPPIVSIPSATFVPGLAKAGNLALPPAAPLRRRFEAPLDHVPEGEANSRKDYGGRLRSILVQPGDTLWKLAQEYLGRGLDWRRLAAANPKVGAPASLQAGTWIHLPEAPARTAPGGRIRVQPGDTLSILARSRFGDATAWPCLTQANPEIKNPNLIFIGQTLTIPGSCSPSAALAAPVTNLSTSR